MEFAAHSDYCEFVVAPEKRVLRNQIGKNVDITGQNSSGWELVRMDPVYKKKSGSGRDTYFLNQAARTEAKR